jgi:hypothetical protein
VTLKVKKLESQIIKTFLEQDTKGGSIPLLMDYEGIVRPVDYEGIVRPVDYEGIVRPVFYQIYIFYY